MHIQCRHQVSEPVLHFLLTIWHRKKGIECKQARIAGGRQPDLFYLESE